MIGSVFKLVYQRGVKKQLKDYVDYVLNIKIARLHSNKTAVLFKKDYPGKLNPGFGPGWIKLIAKRYTLQGPG